MPDRRRPALPPVWGRVLVGLAAGVAAGLVLFGRSGPGRGTPASAPGPRFHFTDVTRESGVRFEHVNGRTGRYRYPEILGAGVALFDYDGDGDLDLFLVNGNRLDGAPDPRVRSALYRNDGHMTFTDVTEKAGLAIS